MTEVKKPTKEQVRKWQDTNRQEHQPPKTPEQVRRELGWELIPENLRKDPK